MPTYFIRNTRELNDLIMSKISRGLLEYVSREVEKCMIKHLAESSISTSSLQQCVTHKINTFGNESIIYIDYDFAQEHFASPPQYDEGKMVEWGRFTNSVGQNAFEQTWNGELVSFRLSEWLEEGGHGNIGNQPITASHWFTKTIKDVEQNLDRWAEKYLRDNKFI